MITGNKGEWSEFYAFIKLLVDKKIIGADEDLEKIESVFFPILKIIREETEGKSEYELQTDDTIKIVHSDGKTSVVNSSDLKTKVVEIFQKIKDCSKTFEVPVAEELFDRFGIHSINAGNARKEDLILRVHDHTIGRDHEIGFSIKSKLGSPATLLNASGATNFTYKINGLPKSAIKKINAVETKAKIRDRLFAIRKAGGSFEFHGIDSGVFEKNLRKIDTIMPEIISEVLLAYYSDKGSTFPELLQHMEDTGVHVLSFKLSTEDYAYKIKALLNNAALGMVPASAWDGTLRAHGGVIVVREDGEIVCYHLYNAEAFRNYLFNNTRMESPSATRHRYGTIYEESGELFIKLNLQIRFIG
ncbi:MAG: HpaII family restriction endonuclease [Patescibacteria group bacterium]|jgi:type II restriction enzyme